MHYISNPFQVLGKSDPCEPAPVPASDAPAESLSPSVATAASAALGVTSARLPEPNAAPLPAPTVVHVPIPAFEIGMANPEVILAEKAQGIIPPAPTKHLSFLHHLGIFLMDSVLPVVLEVGVPILERKL